SSDLPAAAQPLPRQTWTTARGAALRVVPTATHSSAEAHATAEYTCGSDGPAAAVTRHARPSQTSRSPRLPVSVKWFPTAAQNEGETHATPAKPLRRSAESGVGTTRHDVPSQRSTSVWLTSRSNRLPTATQNVGDVHEPPVRSPGPGSFGVAASFQSAGGPGSFGTPPHPASTSASSADAASLRITAFQPRRAPA